LLDQKAPLRLRQGFGKRSRTRPERRGADSDVETVQDLSEVFHRIVFISDGNGPARIGQIECRA